MINDIITMDDKIKVIFMIKYYLGLNAQVSSISILDIYKNDQDKIERVRFTITGAHSHISYEFNSYDSSVEFYMTDEHNRITLLSTEMYEF